MQMHQAHAQYDRQLDQLLKLEYHQICFNPKKRQAFLRLTSIDPTTLNHVWGQNQLNNGAIDNRLLHNYIKQVYEKFGIEDPIKKELRLAARHDPKLTPEKSVNITSISESDRLTRTKKKILNLKDNFKRDSDEVVYSSQFSNNQIYQEGPSTINTSKVNKEIGYRTKQKIRFKTVTNDHEIHNNSPPVLRQFTLTDNRSNPKSYRNLINNPKAIIKQKSKEPSDSFRYCPMCEDMVLEENAAMHQSRCKQLQQAHRLPFDEFERLIFNKIRRMEGQIYNEIFQKNEQNMTGDFADIKSSIKLWMDKSQKSSFEQIKTKFQSFSLNLFDKLCKLNWFRTFQKKMQSELKKGI